MRLLRVQPRRSRRGCFNSTSTHHPRQEKRLTPCAKTSCDRRPTNDDDSDVRTKTQIIPMGCLDHYRMDHHSICGSTACGPAATTHPGAGEAAADPAARSAPSEAGIGGTEPVSVPQQVSGDGEPTPRPTICASTFDDDGKPILHCAPPPPLPAEDSNVEGTLFRTPNKMAC